MKVFKNWRYFFVFICHFISFLKFSHHRITLSSALLPFNYDDRVPFLSDISLINFRIYRYLIPRSARSITRTFFFSNYSSLITLLSALCAVVISSRSLIIWILRIKFHFKFRDLSHASYH